MAVEGEVVDAPSQGLARRVPADVALTPAISVAVAKQRLAELEEFCKEYLQESKDGGTDGGDYGIIPGAGKKRTLFKSGAEKLCDIYGLADRYHIISKVEDFGAGLFDYTIECELTRKADEMFVGSGLGSCNSFEAKYRWRNATRRCPTCGAEAIIKGKEEYGGGWVCYHKKGGCRAKFDDADPKIMNQEIGRVLNPDIADTKNTVLKMAMKRAKIAAVISVTRSSGLFTQDLDDHMTVETDGDPGPDYASESQAAPAAQAKAGEAPPGETHEQKIARIKAEAAAKKPAAATPAASTPAAAPAAKPAAAPAPAPAAKAPEQAKPAAAQGVAPAPVASVDGRVQITGINSRVGPMVMKNGASTPSWGPVIVLTFSAKVKASDGQMVLEALADPKTPEGQAIVDAAEKARDEAKADATKGFLKPVIAPGTRKGSYNLTKFEE